MDGPGLVLNYNLPTATRVAEVTQSSTEAKHMNIYLHGPQAGL